MSEPRKISFEQFQTELEAQGVPIEHCALICPICKTVQSATDLVLAGAGRCFAEVEQYLGFSCIGRFRKGAQRAFGTKKLIEGKGCDYTIGGLFCIHHLEIQTDDGKIHFRFDLATPEQAQLHRLENLKILAEKNPEVTPEMG
jgi:hypothetical protein